MSPAISDLFKILILTKPFTPSNMLHSSDAGPILSQHWQYINKNDCSLDLDE